MTAKTFATLVLRGDAVASAALGTGALVLLATLTDTTGLARVWLAGGAALVLGNAMLCWRAPRGGGPTPGALRGLAAIDVGFTVVVLWFALVDPIGAERWLRVGLSGLAIVVAAVAALKLLLARRAAPGRTAAVRP